MSERILNGTSAVSQYTAIDVDSRWKIQDRRQIKNTDHTETKHNPEKANNAKQNYPGFVAFNDTR